MSAETNKKIMVSSFGVGGITLALLWNIYSTLDARVRDVEVSSSKCMVTNVVTKEDIGDIRTSIAQVNARMGHMEKVIFKYFDKHE